MSLLSRVLTKVGFEENLGTTLHSEHTFYCAFSKDIKRATSRVVVESPCITTRRASDAQKG